MNLRQINSTTPPPPYYAVIFSSVRTDGDNGYSSVAKRMLELLTEQEGYLGMEHARDEDTGITVCYWSSLESIHQWRENAEHKLAQQMGRETFYKSFATRICRVERDTFFEKQ